MDWARILAFVTGLVDQELLARFEYMAVENRILKECLDHMLVFGGRHLRRLLRAYTDYYNLTRTHLSLDKDSPASRATEPFGCICPVPILGGLHYRYIRI